MKPPEKRIEATITQIDRVLSFLFPKKRFILCKVVTRNALPTATYSIHPAIT